jgi:hypothetical protein
MMLYFRNTSYFGSSPSPQLLIPHDKAKPPAIFPTATQYKMATRPLISVVLARTRCKVHNLHS